MDEIGLLKVHCYLLCSMPSRLYSVPVNYQSRKFLGLIFLFYFILNCWMLQCWFLVFTTCNVQTYKIRRLWSFLVAIIKKLAFGKLFMHFLLLCMNQNFSHLISWITQDAMGGAELAPFDACSALPLHAWPCYCWVGFLTWLLWFYKWPLWQ